MSRYSFTIIYWSNDVCEWETVQYILLAVGMPVSAVSTTPLRELLSCGQQYWSPQSPQITSTGSPIQQGWSPHTEQRGTFSGPETCSQQKRGKRLGTGALCVGRLGIRWLSQSLNKIRQLDFEFGIWPNDLKRFVYLLWASISHLSDDADSTEHIGLLYR